MKKSKKILSLILFLLGISFLLNSKISIIGAVIGISAVSARLSFILGIAFISVSLILFIATQKRYALEDIIKKNRERFVIIDTNFLIDNFGRDSERIKDYIISLKNAGYKIVIPREQKDNELQELKRIEGLVDFSEYSDYGRIKHEAEEAIKGSEKYQQGIEFLDKFTNMDDLTRMERRLIRTARYAVNSLSDKGMLPQSKEEAGERIKDWVKKRYTNIETDSALLASAVCGGRDEEVLLISSDEHLNAALKSLKKKHHELKGRIDYRSPEDYNLVA